LAEENDRITEARTEPSLVDSPETDPDNRAKVKTAVVVIIFAKVIPKRRRIRVFVDDRNISVVQLEWNAIES
jgi:hypothetical protein